MLRLDNIHQRENSIQNCLQIMECALMTVDAKSANNDLSLRRCEHYLKLLAGHFGVDDLDGATTGGVDPELMVSPMSLTGVGPVAGQPKQHQFNDNILKSFTRYPHNSTERRAKMLHRGMSLDLDQSGLPRRVPPRNRHYSLSICEDLEEQPVGSSQLLQRRGSHRCGSAVPASSGAINPLLLDQQLLTTSLTHVPGASDPTGSSGDRARHLPKTVCFRDDVYNSCSSSSVNRGFGSGFMAPRGMLGGGTVGLNPIVTPDRLEYTTITDGIDTSGFQQDNSPPNTPVGDEDDRLNQRAWIGGARGSRHHRHKHRHHHTNTTGKHFQSPRSAAAGKRNKRPTTLSANEGLRTVEENEDQQMEVGLISLSSFYGTMHLTL